MSRVNLNRFLQLAVNAVNLGAPRSGSEMLCILYRKCGSSAQSDMSLDGNVIE